MQDIFVFFSHLFRLLFSSLGFCFFFGGIPALKLHTTKEVYFVGLS